ncbi:MAG: nucleotidyltransferase family protein [Clostridium sp.]|nr:nucleotidyltransferase family protein [Clostridium sp.]
MKALIFAAGLGTRLKPFTLEHPKALVPVGGIPMLQRVILKLKAAGITQMVVNVHHFSSQIIEFLRGNDNFGVDLAISDETAQLLDTGGGILAASKWLEGSGPVLVHNADIVTDFDIARMADCHCRNAADATLLVADRKTSRYLLMDDGMRMRGWTNVNTGEVKMHEVEGCGSDISLLNKFAFGGVHVLSQSIFASLRQYAGGREAFPIMPFYIDFCARIKIMGYAPKEDYRWFDVGKPESLALANAAFQ